MKVVLLGPPGAGKGTQALRIRDAYAIPHISTGDMLRSAIRGGTTLGLAAKAYIDKGELVPDEVVIGIVRERLSEDDCRKGFLLDGFPRTVAQARALDGFTGLDAAILIDVDPERLVARITNRRVCPACGGTYRADDLEGMSCPACGEALIQREDDREETVRNRLSVYERQTRPLVEYYREKGILRSVRGDMDIEEVFSAIGAIMESLS